MTSSNNVSAYNPTNTVITISKKPNKKSGYCVEVEVITDKSHWASLENTHVLVVPFNEFYDGEWLLNLPLVYSNTISKEMFKEAIWQHLNELVKHYVENDYV